MENNDSRVSELSMDSRYIMQIAYFKYDEMFETFKNLKTFKNLRFRIRNSCFFYDRIF